MNAWLVVGKWKAGDKEGDERFVVTCVSQTHDEEARGRGMRELAGRAAVEADFPTMVELELTAISYVGRAAK